MLHKWVSEPMNKWINEQTYKQLTKRTHEKTYSGEKKKFRPQLFCLFKDIKHVLFEIIGW